MSLHTQTEIEKLLFNYNTTNRTDYRLGSIPPPVKTEYKEKAKKARPKDQSLKDTHTITDWKLANIPFNLHHKLRDIVQTNPYNVQQSFKAKPVNKDKEAIIKTRPRLVMPPAVAMDDIEDPKVRALLCDDIYTSFMTRANNQVQADYLSVKAPLIGHYTASNPIIHPNLKPPYVSPEWRMETVTWDNKQYRCFCDPTKEFWLKREPRVECAKRQG